MSNDELTPEEREALSNLPRERMPAAGLEDRVVAAMRERGHLTRKPARVIRLTNTRTIGLLAACLVLIVGAYSIGLNRGVDRTVLTNIEPRQDYLSPAPATAPARDEEKDLGVESPVAREEKTLREKATASGSGVTEQGFIDKKAPPFEPKLDAPQLAARKDARKEKQVKADEVNEAMTKSFSDRLSAESAQPAPATDLARPASPPMPAQLRAGSLDKMSVSGARAFALNGGTLIVDAPDSLRIVTDEQGRVLLIYTSDGVIRIRLAE